MRHITSINKALCYLLDYGIKIIRYVGTDGVRESAARGAGDLQTVPSRFKLNINGHAEGALPLYLPH